ncbi:MAG: hypothetical protein KF887_04760 [Paracoccaceae bacterium]|nr:MAG: hypothetical protein KF887_04760 [Paracoccaceae bacterium]
MPRNLTSPRARWRSADPMAAHDRLPPALRRWAAQAALPWSAASLLRLWRRAIAETGSEAEALRRLSRAETATLAREAPAVWGAPYPFGALTNRR